MHASTVKVTRPIVHSEALWFVVCLLFVVYEFGWGFRA